MDGLKTIVQLFIIVSFFVGNIFPHAGMKYPPPRPILSNGFPHEEAGTRPILPKGTRLTLLDKHVITKPFPCGSSHPNRDKFRLEKGKALPVEIEVVNSHKGGTCQFSISYDDAKTFVAFHQVVNDCLNIGDIPGKTKINVPIPNDLPGGNAVFAWTWITKSSETPEFYMSCSDVIIDGPTVGKMTGYPLVVVNIEDKGTHLEFFSGAPDYSFLFQKKPELLVSVNGNIMELNNKVFTPTRHLKINDPLLSEFKKTISSTTKTETPEVKAASAGLNNKQPLAGTKQPGKGIEKPPGEMIIPQETIKNAIKYVSNVAQQPNMCNGRFFSKK
ncbi:hypothetical protein HMI54_002180 [Coelomomyces lativittatus]|nr:hypothetical protein HMI56_000571 [Coelomomyces lativittatus]KAJ1509061.1 hypothetical protein HMI55_000114 [Coelomomyces lativittatus]KAJ1509691.1 hypothetical protein HMI54_002180 [Coelomomyces lativittatus]